MDLEKNVIIDPSINLSVSNNAVNMSVNGGIELGFVGASPSSISNPELAKRFDAIVDAAQKKFFGPNGSLEKKLDPAALQAFKEAKKLGDIKAYDQALFNLKNVLYGEMTVGNVSYFNMMIDEINKWLV